VALARRLKMPVRLLTVLEGEGLVNDATALILLSFGVQAVSAGGLSLTDAALRFILIVAGEIVWGLLAGFAALRLRARMNDPQSEITLALLTPFLAFWPPHMLGGSGVLAALAAGLYVSWHGPRFISPATRIQGFFVWGLVTHVLEGVLFLLIGLQARGLADALGRGDAHRLILAVALTGFVVVAARFIWIYPASALPRFIAARLGRKTPATEPGSAFLIAFTGIRGAVSLAGAFSIPALVHERAFPERELILFVTFCVIVLTLVGQGSLLPMVLRRLGLVALGEAEAREERRREVMARIKGVEAALERLDQAEQSGAPAPVVRLLRRRHEDRLQSYRRAAEKAAGHPVSDPSRLHVVLIEAERARLAELYAAKAFGDEARRRMERELDLQHALSRHSAESATGRSFDELL
jgi:CPA1 family monovalent cation:H+ antiporter